MSETCTNPPPDQAPISPDEIDCILDCLNISDWLLKDTPEWRAAEPLLIAWDRQAERYGAAELDALWSELEAIDAAHCQWLRGYFATLERKEGKPREWEVACRALRYQIAKVQQRHNSKDAVRIMPRRKPTVSPK